MKRALQVLCLGLILFLSACGGKTTMIKTTTAKEVTDPNDKTDYNLWYSDDTDTILLSNNLIRIKFDKTNGAIREIYNKTSDIYLIKDIDSLSPITLQTNGHYSDNFITPLDNTFKYNLIANSNTIKTIQMEWKFENDVVAKANVTLEGPSDEIAFEVELSNLDGETSSVQYPIVDQITGISDSGKDDYFLTSFATGYLVENPVRNCNKYGLQFTGEDAIYPMGFGSTMQFMSYFVKDEGGFLLQTKDKGDTIKSFNLRTNGDSISLDIGHFVNDLTKKTEKFKYQTVIKNLYEGNWYEAAEVYKAWAVTQPWCTKNGLNATRNDLNKDLYENAILCNFIVPATNEQQYADELYMKIRNNFNTEGAKILTIPFYYSITQEVKPGENIKAYFETHANPDFYELLADYGDPIAFFEYTDLHRETSMSILPDYVTSTVMKSYNGTNESITCT